jgi:hypothetical protein
MADEARTQADEAHAAYADSLGNEGTKAKAEPAPSQSEAEEAPPESSTKGILRQAIQKVMEEIAFHEREAEKHLQQAKALRRDLRDSFSFLQERKEEPAPKSRPAESAKPASATSQALEAPVAGKAQRGRPKKPKTGKPASKPASGSR